MACQGYEGRFLFYEFFSNRYVLGMLWSFPPWPKISTIDANTIKGNGPERCIDYVPKSLWTHLEILPKRRWLKLT